MTEFFFETGGLTLASGTKYITFLNASNQFWDNNTTQVRVGFQNRDVYSDGEAWFQNTANDFNNVRTLWGNNFGSSDLVFRATFAPLTEPTIDAILEFFDASVANGSLVGSGPGKSANGRRNALRNMIEAAGDLIDDGYIEEACQQLLDAYQRCDGLPRPPEFVAGPAASTLAQMILDLMGELDCE